MTAQTGGEGSFTGHRVLLSYELAGDEAAGSPATTPGAASAELDAEGRFSLTLPDLEEIGAPIEAAVIGPTGVVRARKAVTLSALQSPPLRLQAEPSPGETVRPSEVAGLGQLPRLLGRVIDKTGASVPAGLPVVVWGTPGGEAGAPARALLSVETQSGGYFGGPWPPDALASALATVLGENRQPIPLDGGKLPRRVILVVDGLGDSHACDCEVAPPRAPGQDDLVANPAAFSQDLGGTCVDLTMPNRVLEEFEHVLVVRSTEPEVRPVSLAPPTRLPDGLRTELERVVQPSPNRVTGMLELPSHAGVVAPVGGEAGAGGARGTLAPELLGALDTTATMELLRSPEGVSLDTLHASALTAASREALRLVDLHRSDAVARRELDGADPIAWDAAPTLYEAVSVAIGHVLRFRQVWRADGYSLGDLVHSIPLAPGQKRQIAVVDWERQTTAARSELLESEEAMQAFAERDRDIAEIAATSLDERVDAGSSSSTSAGGGGIGAGFIGSGFGIFGGVAGGASSSESSSWQDSARALAANSMQNLSDRTAQRAAAQRDLRSTVVQTVAQDEQVQAQTETIANYNHCHAITVEMFEVLRHFQVTHELASVGECLFVPLSMTPFDQAKARRWRAALAERLRDRSLLAAFDALERIAVQWQGWDFPSSRFSEEPPEALEGELRVSFLIPRPRDAEDGKFQVDAWEWLAPLLDTSALALWNAQLAAREQAQRDAYFRDHVAPQIAEQLMHRLRFGYVTRGGTVVAAPLRATLVSRYEEGVPLYVSLRPAGPPPPLAREQIARFRVWFDGLALPPDARLLVTSGRMRYQSEHFGSLLFDEARIDNDLAQADSIVIATPVRSEERRNPRADDERLADRLVRHLNEELEHYHQAIWLGMDPARRYMLLDGVLAPGAEGRSVASVVENRLIGVVGNCLVLPVTPGIHLDPTLVSGKDGKLVDLVNAYAPEPPPPIRISLPTRGVYAEAVMGACDSCEQKDDTRFWRWEEAPDPDEPTPIAPVSTESRAAPEPSLTPTSLPQPIVNIQSAAPLPDPVGLQQALEVLGRSDVFRDPTGLAGTQRNALAAFKGVMDTAKQFGGTAARLAQQQELSRNVDRTLGQISQARDSGMLSQQQAQSLAHSALQGLVGTTPGPARAPVSDPAVASAIQQATQASSGEVSVTTPEESVHTAFDGGGTALGSAAAPIAFHDVEEWITLPLVQDSVSSVAPFVYSRPPAAPKIETVSALRSQPPLRTIVRGSSGEPEVLDMWDALIALGRIRVNPADSTRFQVRLRLRVCYPSVAGHKDQLAGAGAPSPTKLPLVVLAHGNHQSWRKKTATSAGKAQVFVGGERRELPLLRALTVDESQSYLGYEYLQEELARNGVVSASVDSNFANFFGCLIQTRADLIRAAFDELHRQATTPASRYLGRLDFDNAGLVGHSRGGDAVVQAARELASIGSSTTVRAVCSLAPTDFTGADPASPTVLGRTDVDFYHVLYGALDGDVSGIDGADGPAGTGFRHYDRAQCQKAMTFLDRFSHNGFNTVWIKDGNDTNDPRCRPEKDHQQIAREYIGGLMRWRLKGERPLARLFDGRTANALGEHVCTQWAFGASAQELDDFEQANENSLLGHHQAIQIPPATVALEGFAAIAVGGVRLGWAQTSQTPLVTEVHTGHQTQVVHVDLTGAGVPAPGASARFLTTDIPSGSGDWSAFDTLLVSLAGFFDPKSEASIAAAPLPRIKVTLIDRAAKGATVDWNLYGQNLPSRPVFKELLLQEAPEEIRVNLTLMRLETIPIALTAFAGVDLTQLAQVAFDADFTNATHLFVDNLHVVKREP